MSTVPAPARALARLGAVRGSFAGATGMATLDASSDFQRARRAYVAARLARGLTPGRRGPSRPCALDRLPALSWRGARLRVIPLSAVIGTIDVTHDFDAHFRPAAPHLAARWQHVALAHRRGAPLPPISVIERPEGYYILDGRHRVSVARALRHRDIEAWVSPVVTVDPPAPRPTNGCDEERGSLGRRATISPQSKGKIT
jgi:hypothetical protein